MSNILSFSPSTDEMDESTVRMVLLGKTGSGKSATGNSILSREAFTAQCSPESTTKICRKENNEENRRLISVIDTPGLCDTSMSPEEVKREIKKCVYMSVPGPHVFLLVIRLGVKITEEEQNTVKWIQKNFGEDASRYTIIVFTFKDSVKGTTVQEYIHASKYLRNLINSCGNRYTFLNNEDPDDRTQVNELLKKIQELIQENGGKSYTNTMYEEAQEKIRQEEERVRQEEERQKEEEKQRIIEEYERIKNRWKAQLKSYLQKMVNECFNCWPKSVFGKVKAVMIGVPVFLLGASFLIVTSPIIFAVWAFRKIRNKLKTEAEYIHIAND
uniref:AIG1-type G domain-containing protein n=1 Tax=Astyanax mexicanus TaxID=7994 RepID=A0A8B9JR78_ASTMX